jgi:Domain of unknown function (DUF4864)
MTRLIIALLLTLFVSLSQVPAASAADDTLAAARAAITAQIEAFKRDDGAAAYGFAAPEIQQYFATPENFMGMVRGGYQPVYRPRSYSFQPGAVASNGTITQALDIVGPDGGFWVAEYSLKTMPDGTIRITGCRLIKRDGVGA